MHIVVLAPGPQTIETLPEIILGTTMNYRSGVPTNAWHTLESVAGGGGAKALEGTRDEAKTSDIWGFGGAGEEGLQADADTEKGLASGYMFLDCGEKAGGSEAGEAVAEMADAWEDEFLEADASSDL